MRLKGSKDRSKKSKSSIKDKKHYFHYLVILIIFIIFLFDRILAIWLGFIFIVIIFAFYFPSLSFKNRLTDYMKKHKTIDDRALAEKFKRPIEEIKEEMKKVSSKNQSKDWIISDLNNRCVFYNKEVVEKLIDLYNLGMNEKQIFEKLKKNSPIKTRAEIKAIEDILISQKKIKKRTDKFK